jgi:ADP-ribose pyrophosphatase YjhB (NUDIX family)
MFDQGGGRFNFRVAGVALAGSRVFVHRNVKDDFWTLPGGRVEMGEATADALRREMREELGIDVAVGRLLWVIENFFEYDARRYHEIAFYYEMELPAGCRFAAAPGPFRLREAGVDFDYLWVDAMPACLADLPLFPATLRERLARPPECVEHLVSIE